MSFSHDAKDELCRQKLKKDCCRRAEIAAFLHTIGTIRIKSGRNINLKFHVENAAVARRIYELIKSRYNIMPEIAICRNEHFQKSHGYNLLVTDSASATYILKDTGILYDNADSDVLLNYKIDKDIVKNRCCQRAYLRAAFLGVGSITNPEKDYHLELVASNELYAQSLVDLMRRFNIDAKYIERKNNYVVYLKGSEQIIHFLNVINAINSLLEIENVKVYKNMRNNINRIVNCETANLTKTIDAAWRQTNDIQYIRDTVGLDVLPIQLRQLAQLRLDYSDASLKELGEMLDPPLSKSGVNHRLRKIERIAESLRAEKGVVEDDTKKS